VHGEVVGVGIQHAERELVVTDGVGQFGDFRLPDTDTEWHSRWFAVCRQTFGESVGSSVVESHPIEDRVTLREVLQLWCRITSLGEPSHCSRFDESETQCWPGW